MNVHSWSPLGVVGVEVLLDSGPHLDKFFTDVFSSHVNVREHRVAQNLASSCFELIEASEYFEKSGAVFGEHDLQYSGALGGSQKRLSH